MSIVSFKDWFYSQESSAFTRSRDAAFWGLGPKIASPFSRSTPHPAMVDDLLKDLEDDKDKKPKKKKKKKKKKIDENKGRLPDYSFDTFLKKAQAAKSEIDKEIEDAEEKEDELDKEFEKKKLDDIEDDSIEKDSDIENDIYDMDGLDDDREETDKKAIIQRNVGED